MHSQPQRHALHSCEHSLALGAGRDTEDTIYFHKDLTEKLIACAIEVHRHLGPGLLESAYEECYCYELKLQGVSLERQKQLPLVYKEITLDCGYRMDVVADKKVVIEIKCVEKILPIHEAQLLTYLKLSGMQVGLIINFHSPTLKDGIKRFVH
jgi:GxxExxY protein